MEKALDEAFKAVSIRNGHKWPNCSEQFRTKTIDRPFLIERSKLIGEATIKLKKAFLSIFFFEEGKCSRIVVIYSRTLFSIYFSFKKIIFEKY